MERLTVLLVVALVSGGCGEQTGSPKATPDTELVGQWRSVLETPGGELPFFLRIAEQDGALAAVVVNDIEEAPLSAVRIDGTTVTLEMAWYDSELEGTVSGDGSRIAGHWRKTVPGGDSVLPWTAERGLGPRFEPIAETDLRPGAADALSEISGVWRLVFVDHGGEDVVRGELRQVDGRVTGTMLTSVGDYRYLDGSYESGVLRLSTFDGAHAFLFHGRAQPDGRLVGDSWSRDSYHATWVGERVQNHERILPDPWQQVIPTQADRRFRFNRPDSDGELVSNEDARFVGKVLVVNLFGSWCPNCNDEAPLLADWHRRWSADGLEIVGLAFEFSGDPKRDRLMLNRYAERHGIEYPLLLAGLSDKAEAAEVVPDISAVNSYPTTILVARDGAIRWIHSGFAGPGTGRHHESLVAELEQRIETLLSEPALAPSTGGVEPSVSFEGFSWVVPGELAAMPLPGGRRALGEDVSFLEHEGIRTLVSLTDEPPNTEVFAVTSIGQVHIPVPDFTAPSIEQIVGFVAVVRDSAAQGKAVGVHCTAGLGRSGTMAAAYLVAQGTPALDAIATLRQLRPGSIETKAQEVAIIRYEEYLSVKSKTNGASGEVRYVDSTGRTRVLPVSKADLEATRKANAGVGDDPSAGSLSVGGRVTSSAEDDRNSLETQAEKTEDKANKKQVTVYSATWCPHCARLKKYLEANNIEADIIEVDLLPPEQQLRTKALMRRLTDGNAGFPTVVIDGKAKSGYSESWIESALKAESQSAETVSSTESAP